MTLARGYMILISGMPVVIIQFMFLNSLAQILPADFEGMKGTRFTHQTMDKTDSLSAKKIIELRDTNGIPLWFSRDIVKNVCLTGECRMVRLRIYWDGASNYLGLQIPKDEPLTKTNHSVFKPEDYQKLDLILSDSLSILKRLRLQDLTVEIEDKNKDQVDGHSGATQPSIYESVVRNAVYTCYTLWHTVYGITRKDIQSILEQKADKAYLQLLISQNDRRYQVWAVDFIGKHPEFNTAFYPKIMRFIKSEDAALSQMAIHYFTSARLEDSVVQKELALVFGEVSSESKYGIIQILSALSQISNDAILILLEQYKKQMIGAGQLGYVCKLIRPENLRDIQIIKKLKHLSTDKNLYVRNISQKLLLSIK